MDGGFSYVGLMVLGERRGEEGYVANEEDDYDGKISVPDDFT